MLLNYKNIVNDCPQLNYNIFSHLSIIYIYKLLLLLSFSLKNTFEKVYIIRCIISE